MKIVIQDATGLHDYDGTYPGKSDYFRVTCRSGQGSDGTTLVVGVDQDCPVVGMMIDSAICGEEIEHLMAWILGYLAYHGFHQIAGLFGDTIKAFLLVHGYHYVDGRYVKN